MKKYERIHLIHGEAIEEMTKLIQEGVKVDAVITDPPQGKTACKWDVIIPFEPMWECIKGLRKDRTPIVLFGNEPFSSMLRMSNLKEYKYDWYWNKIQGTGHLNSKKQPLKNIECISVFYKTQCGYNPQFVPGKPYKCKSGKGSNNYGKQVSVITINKGNRYPLILLNFNKDKSKLHSTQKPVPLVEYLIKTYTKEGDLVLDFTMGSGSTGEACANLNRRFIGIEKDKDIFNKAKDRCKQFISNYALIAEALGVEIDNESLFV